jgi:cytoskeletal protein CcmA (bactofilin family)
MYDASELLIEDGNFRVSGSASITGTLTGSGTVTWTGPSNWNGPTNIGGSCTITGTLQVNSTTTLNGAVTLNNNLTLGTGTIKAGSVTIDKLGTASGRIWSSGQMVVSGTSVYLGASTTVAGPLGVQGNINASGDVGGNTKSFWIDHPTKPGKQLRHGSTESPAHGVEYWDTARIGSNGKVTVTLPDYFEALTLQQQRNVQVTAVGQPFAVGADRISAGKFVVYGAAGRDVDWHVSAVRSFFDVEPDAA